MARPESARSVRRGCFLREWRSPFVRVMAKQRRSVVPAAVTHLAAPHWQAKPRAMLRPLFQANSWVKTADWRPPLLGLPLKANLVVWTADPPSPGLRRVGWRPPLLEPQD